MPTLGAPLDFAKLEARNIRAHQLGADPSTPVSGQLYYHTGTNTLMWYDSNLAAFVSARGGAGSVPDATTGVKGIVQLTGDLAGAGGSATNLQITANCIVAGDIANATITDVQIAAANKDGAVGTASMRTIGTTSVQAMAGNTRLDTIASPLTPGASPVSMNSNKLTNVTDPTLAQDAATKNYVDTFAQGLDSHPSVHAATTANITTLAGGAPNTLDGVTLVLGDRVLVKDQSTTNQNGIYTITTLGTGANGTWARAADQDTWAEIPSAYVWVEMGTINADTGWTCTADPGGTLGTTAITWVQFSSAGTAIAGAGLTKTGNTLDVVGTANRITVGADTVDIHINYAGQTSIATLGTVTTGGWTASNISIARGGTGQLPSSGVDGTQTAAGARTNLNAAGIYTSITHGATASWTYSQATHGLAASKALIVQCMVDSTGAVVLPDIAVDGTGLVTITFAVAQTANTIRTTIMG
jgi:hypothetical protein